MSLFLGEVRSLEDLSIRTLCQLYFAKNQFGSHLPAMIETATCLQLKSGLALHLADTKKHVKLVRQVFQMRGMEAREAICPAFVGILKEADDVAGEVDDKTVLDAALIAAARAVAHHGMARYASLVLWAKQLGRSDGSGLFQRGLEDEKSTDRMLTALADRSPMGSSCVH